jgi:hypothetical protein
MPTVSSKISRPANLCNIPSLKASWHQVSAYQTFALLVCSATACLIALQPQCSGQTVQKVRHQECLVVVLCLSGRDRFIMCVSARNPKCFFYFALWGHCTSHSDIFWYGKVYFSNLTVVTNFMQSLIYSRLKMSIYIEISRTFSCGTWGSD